MSDIEDRVRKIVVEHLNVDADKVTKRRASSTIWARIRSIRSSW